MMIYILFISWVVTASVVADTLHPIKTEDLKSIVDSVKKDVDRHLKMAYAARRMESISLPDPELFAAMNTDNGKAYKNFMKTIQDSMHHHLVRSLGEPSGVENDGSTVYTESTLESKSTFSKETASEQASKSADDISEESSQIYQIRVGSKKGAPGVDFPDYTDIPITSFACSEKPHFHPGFYADLDTGCQVFHVCWPDRRESFLCPMGTTFNQALRVCDYWYNSNCSLAPYYYIVNTESKPDLSEAESSTINKLLEKTDSDATLKPDSSTYGPVTSDSVAPFISKFIPIKAKIAVYPQTATQRLKIVTTASIGESKKSDFKQKPRRKNVYTSKHSRIPRSVEYTKSIKDTDQNAKDLPQLPLARISYLLLEALDRAVVDIENNETFSNYSGYARTAVENIKSFFLWLTEEPLKDFNPDPGSEMYKEDMEMREMMEDDWLKNALLLVSVLMNNYKEREAKFLREFEASKLEPLTNLNPRFVIKPAAEKIAGLQNELPTLVKRSANSSKLSHEDRLNINSETKQLLLKNYMKLFKIKHAHA